MTTLIRYVKFPQLIKSKCLSKYNYKKKQHRGKHNWKVTLNLPVILQLHLKMIHHLATTHHQKRIERRREGILL